MPPYIRIESDQQVITNAKVFFVDGDQETDISRCVQSANIHIGIGEMPTVTLRAHLGGVAMTTPRLKSVAA